jgi:hypothetical protein
MLLLNFEAMPIGQLNQYHEELCAIRNHPMSREEDQIYLKHRHQVAERIAFFPRQD